MPRQLLKWEVTGVFFIIGVGLLLHSLFAWSGSYRPLALIAAVNESTWEHLKLVFWPALIWGILMYLSRGPKLPNLLVAKTVSLYFIPFFIVLLVNTYTRLTGSPILALDIAIFCLAIIGGQLVSYLLLRRRRFCPMANLFSLCFLVLLISCFSTFTFFPPVLPLFIDPYSGLPGIPPL